MDDGETVSQFALDPFSDGEGSVGRGGDLNCLLDGRSLPQRLCEGHEGGSRRDRATGDGERDSHLDETPAALDLNRRLIAAQQSPASLTENVKVVAVELAVPDDGETLSQVASACSTVAVKAVEVEAVSWTVFEGGGVPPMVSAKGNDVGNRLNVTGEEDTVKLAETTATALFPSVIVTVVEYGVALAVRLEPFTENVSVVPEVPTFPDVGVTVSQVALDGTETLKVVLLVSVN